MRTDKQKNLRKLKYQLVLQVTGDIKSARRARDLGSTSLLKNYGVVLPKNQTKPREVTKATIQRRRREATKAKQLIGAGVPLQDAKVLSKKSKIFIQNYIEKLYTTNRTVIKQSQIESAERQFKRLSKPTEIDRVNQWKDWAKKDSEYPQSIEQMAIKINRSQGFDDSSAYGWAVVNQAYVKNIPIEEAIANHTPYYNYGGEIYERVELITA